MPAKTTTTKSKADKTPARKTPKPAASVKSSSTRSRSALKPAKGSKTEAGNEVTVAEKSDGQAAAAPATKRREPATPVSPAPTKSAFAPITAKKAPAEPAAPVAPEPPAPKATVESVSLIDPHVPKPKRAPSDEAVKRTILPPISRIRATPATPEPVREETPPPAPVTPAEEVSEVETETEDGRRIIHIKPPIIVKDLAAQLGLKNFQLIKELMDDYNIFA
ncbi:MAG TPA: hypothetical protein VJS88_06985, partial [Chthoniobacterales bacterium]|nr:hypothetical protein [Chthoniobacterales bacterium]